MKQPANTRRRFLGIIAASTTLLGTNSLASVLNKSAPMPQAVYWQGIALGADAQMQLLHPDQQHAERLLEMAVAEIYRLENIFSLYLDDSALSVLNAQGQLDNAPAEMRELLSMSKGFGQLTNGAFDPSIQVLWDLYAAQLGAGRDLPPPPAQLQQALQLVDYRQIQLDDRTVRLALPGMRLSLNGIAQGYITDRITQLLSANGLEHAMIDLGEQRALGVSSQARPWRAGLAKPDDIKQYLQVVELDNQALATSGGYGTPLDAAGRYTHLFNPHTGTARPLWQSVSVRAADATTADALATGFSQMPVQQIQTVVSQLGIDAWLLPHGSDKLMHIA